jgi:hypothetical protein
VNVPALRALFILAAAAAACFSLVHSDIWYLVLIAAGVFVLVALKKQDSGDDTTILLLASGEVLVVAVAAASFLSGFVVQCAVIGAVLAAGRGMADTRDRTFFALFCLAALGGAILFDRSNQLLLPFLAATALVAAATAIVIGVLEIRDRRTYSGATE